MRSGAITLFIDTSSSFLYSGLIKEEQVIEEVKENLGKKLSEESLAKIEEMFQKAKISPKEVEKIVVVNGPGSFTGIRIGVTIAKTYAWALKKEITTISSLEAMAVSTKVNGLKVPYIDARRGFVYAGVYDSNNRLILEDQYIKLTELEEFLKEKQEKYTWIGNDEVPEITKKTPYKADILQIVMASKDKKSINPHAVNPVYLKKTEAEENKGIEAA